MKVLVYEVVRCFEVDVEGTGPTAMRDAVARVERGDVPPSDPECRHIAFPACSRIKPVDPREVLRALIRATPERRLEAAQKAGVFSPLDPSGQDEWLAAVVKRAVSEGKLAALLSAL